MEYRRLGRTGRKVSTIGFGAWAIGGADWGEVSDDDSLRALHAAAEAGVTFIDTADVYGDGRSERVIARFLEFKAHDGGPLAQDARLALRSYWFKFSQTAP